jgi:ribose transport system permease protein
MRFFKVLWTEYSIVLVFIVIFVACSLLSPRFATINNIMAILRNSSIVGMIALGMTFVIITGGIDLSCGHILATCGAALILLQRNENIPIPLAILACVSLAVLLGTINGLIITKAHLPPFIVTLAVGTLARSVTMYRLRGATIAGRAVPEFTTIGNGSVGFIPIPLIIFIVSALILGGILAYTKFGSYVYAVGGNENAAKYSGIRTNRIKVYAYMLTGFCIGIAATIDMSRMAAVSATMSGNSYEFDAITAVIVGGATLSGGRGKMIGTVIGVIILGIVSNLMVMLNISPYLNGAVKGGVILTAVLLQRQEK